MAGGRRLRGGICQLLDLIEEHRGAIEYDFRTRFPGLREGVNSVPDEMGWGEALRLVRILRSDPSTMLAAAVEQWEYPLSRTDAILADMWDLSYAKAGAKKRERYPRPFKQKAGKSQKWGDTAGRSRDQIVEILRAHGHELS